MIKKKIAVFGVKGFPSFGGASRANESVVDLLKSKYEYTIYSVSTHTNKKGVSNGYYQKVFKGLKGKRLNTLMYHIKSLLHALFLGDYDIVHVNHTSAGFMVPFLRLRFKVVSTARGVIPIDDNKWNKLDKFLFDLSAYLFFQFSNISISVSDPHISLFKKYTRKKIIYIPNGIELMKPNEVVREEFIMFAAGRIISLKGAHVLIAALNKMKYKGKTIFVGNLDHTPKYKDQLFELGKERDIDYVGLIKEKDKLYNYISKSKIFVFPSFNEGMSNMLLEVASLKTPLICSDIPENKAIFSDKEVLYFESGNEEDLAIKIKYAIANYSVMEEMAENAYSKLQKEYLWTDIAESYSEIYDSLLI